MMKSAYLTGLTGTVAPYLKHSLFKQGIHTVGQHIHLNDENQIQDSIHDLLSHDVHYVFHLGLGPIAWAHALAKVAYQNHIVFVYISSVSVFDDNASGPYALHEEVKAKSGYGLYKFQCEQAVKQANPDAYIIRIGWQIDPHQNKTSNNMFKFFNDQIQSQGKITVSSQFFPSCSFLPDTTNAIVNMALSKTNDLYYINANPGFSLYDIALKLKARYALDWIVQKEDSFQRNDILIDSRIVLPLL